MIAWIAAQDWCDGNVGMVGISWGGFNGLQVAALQPPALKAVITLCSTDDRYADDVHYMGGTMVIDQISWASHMFAINTLPPDPRPGWRPLARHVDGSADGLGPLAEELAGASDARRFLEARLGLRGLSAAFRCRSMRSAAGPTAIAARCSA